MKQQKTFTLLRSMPVSHDDLRWIPRVVEVTLEDEDKISVLEKWRNSGYASLTAEERKCADLIYLDNYGRTIPSWCTEQDLLDMDKPGRLFVIVQPEGYDSFKGTIYDQNQPTEKTETNA